jgi:NADPH:quinone reductase-like Zn-dependent oxidoreductase
MRSYHATLGGGIDGLTVREHERPEPVGQQVLVRLRASSLNYRELMILDGWYSLPVKADVVPCCDGAGEVVGVGDQVRRLRVGDRVSAAVFPRWRDGRFRLAVADQLGGTLDGMLREYALLDEDALVTIPEHLTYEQAATLPCAAVTAWNALTGGRGLVPGERVLTLGSGAVSLFAVQLASALGAHVIATTSGPEKATRLRALGAHEVIDYHATPAWPERVRALTDDAGVDHVIEVVGQLDQSIRAAAPLAEIAFVGLLGEDAARIPLDPKLLWTAAIDVRRIAVGSRAQFQAMNDALETHRLVPVIERIFTFDEAIDAFRYYQAHRPMGKLVIHHD